MAFIRTIGNDYLCLSSDAVQTKGVGTGQVLTQIDTGKRFIFYDGWWQEDLTLVYAINKAMSEL
jgi:hypothetical protein